MEGRGSGEGIKHGMAKDVALKDKGAGSKKRGERETEGDGLTFTEPVK